MIDSHCHIDLPAFDADRAQVIQTCSDLQIERLLVPGLSLEQAESLLDLKQQFPIIDIAFGLHPYFLKSLNAQQRQSLQDKFTDYTLQHQRSIVAIGECGLDASLPLPMDYQQEMLSFQIALAAQLNKPLVLHHRQSHNELIRMLKQQRFSNGGVIHAFSGSKQIAHSYIDMGFYLGVGGTITYPRAKKTRETIQNVALEHLLLETDSPDMPLHGHQGKRNSPTQLPLVVAALSALKQIDERMISEQTTANYMKLFKG